MIIRHNNMLTIMQVHGIGQRVVFMTWELHLNFETSLRVELLIKYKLLIHSFNF